MVSSNLYNYGFSYAEDSILALLALPASQHQN